VSFSFIKKTTGTWNILEMFSTYTRLLERACKVIADGIAKHEWFTRFIKGIVKVVVH
jgi:hypothetical protein